MVARPYGENNRGKHLREHDSIILQYQIIQPRRQARLVHTITPQCEYMWPIFPEADPANEVAVQHRQVRMGWHQGQALGFQTALDTRF